MADITAAMVGELRGMTGAGLIDCKKALIESNGNMDDAVQILKKKGVATAEKKSGRDIKAGLITSYIHNGGRVGVLLELGCESDFVAKNETFQAFAKDLCMQIAAASPIAVSREEVSADLIAKETEVARAQCAGKPEAAIEKIVEGKLNKWFAGMCLMEQAFVKNPDQTIKDLVTEKIATIGENIKISKFARFQIG